MGRVVSGRTTLPILSNVLLEAREGQLRVVTYDMEIGAESMVAIEAEEEGALTVPARVLSDVVASLPDATIQLERRDQSLLHLSCGRSEYTINGLPAEEYPALPEVSGQISFEVSQAGMRELIRSTIFAASGDETRAILTGVLMRRDGDVVKMVATDSYRLAVKTAPAEALKLSTPEETWRAIIPARALQELSRMLDPAAEETPVKVRVGDQRQEGSVGQARERQEAEAGYSQIEFEVGPYTLVSRLIAGQYPNYERIIPTESNRRIVVNRADLEGAIRRAAIVARAEASKLVFRTQEGLLTISAESGDVGRAHEELAATLEGEDIEIAFNAEYLSDVLGVMECETVVWELTGQLSQGVLKAADDPDYLYIVMPMQL